jgi:imidazolonepropionase-like amidohydrolase
VAWTFTGTLLDGLPGDQVTAGTGDPRELPGRFALAGLVDAHAHPTVAAGSRGPCLAGRGYAETRLAGYAAAGITVIRDAGGRGELTLAFAAAPADGHPAVTAAGRFLAPAGRYYPRLHHPVTAGELTAAIAAEVAAGAAWVKIIGDFPRWTRFGPVPRSAAAAYDPAALRRAIAAAHAAGARVAVHSTMAGAGLAALGADSVEHGQGLRPADLEQLGARGGAWTPTLCAVLPARDAGRAARRRAGELRGRLRYAVACGVAVLAGTDGAGPLADEIALLAAHGLSPAEAIAAAGSGARAFLGLHPVGDIVTYDEDPRADPGALARPAAVVVRGVRVR